MLLNFKPAGCEDNMNKAAMKNHVNNKSIEYEDYEDDDDDDDDEFVFDFNDSKKAPPVNNFFDSQKVSKNHEVQEQKPLLLINKKESDLVIDFKQAIINHNVDKVKRLLDENGGEINVNYVFNNSWSPLMYAITSGCFELIDYFISKGANVNHKADRVTVLMCACACRRIDDVRLVEIVELLIKAGANYHSTDRYLIIKVIYFFNFFLF
jgi:ankyrin repeat protein